MESFNVNSVKKYVIHQCDKKCALLLSAKCGENEGLSISITTVFNYMGVNLIKIFTLLRCVNVREIIIDINKSDTMCKNLRVTRKFSFSANFQEKKYFFYGNVNISLIFWSKKQERRAFYQCEPLYEGHHEGVGGWG